METICIFIVTHNIARVAIQTANKGCGFCHDGGGRGSDVHFISPKSNDVILV